MAKINREKWKNIHFIKTKIGKLDSRHLTHYIFFYYIHRFSLSHITLFISLSHTHITHSTNTHTTHIFSTYLSSSLSLSFTRTHARTHTHITHIQQKHSLHIFSQPLLLPLFLSHTYTQTNLPIFSLYSHTNTNTEKAHQSIERVKRFRLRERPSF